MHLSFTRQLCKKYFFDTKILFKNASKKNPSCISRTDFLMVGVAGLEPAASWSRTKHTTKLCHTPIALSLYRMVERLSRFGSDFCRIFSKKAKANAKYARLFSFLCIDIYVLEKEDGRERSPSYVSFVR